ncbi:MAG TPA: alpha/beta hydrolase [Xanthobacteraceae bacterium]|nr:alpha/beta hydrolase [Xanthobacteraceae bacterium]
MTDAATKYREMPANLVKEVTAIGRIIDPEKTAALYAPFAQKPPYKNVKVARDVKYGPAALQALDVFSPEAATGARPVLIFVHGGGYVAGDKCEPGKPFHDNIMLWAVKNGMVGVNINYRLAPAAPWPAGAEDTGAAVGWVADHIASYGGDPKRIFLMGHSAGAQHVASYIAHPQFQGAKGVAIAGAILVSGTYDLTRTETIEDRFKVYFGADQSQYAERSSVTGLAKSNVPILLATGELNMPRHLTQYNVLKDALSSRKHSIFRAFIPPHHSHISEIYAINTEDESLTGPMREFIESVS